MRISSLVVYVGSTSDNARGMAQRNLSIRRHEDAWLSYISCLLTDSCSHVTSACHNTNHSSQPHTTIGFQDQVIAVVILQKLFVPRLAGRQSRDRDWRREKYCSFSSGRLDGKPMLVEVNLYEIATI